MDLKFQGKYLISGKIICETGLHIGGTTEGFEIGGVDNPVMRDPLTEWPYIPGSSLKGKLRYLLEWSLGENPFTGKPYHFTIDKKSKGEPTFQPCSCGRCEACVLFGTTPESGVVKQESNSTGFAIPYVSEEGGETYLISGPGRLTVRDMFPTDETLEQWKKWLGENIFTELKTENTIDRVTSEANPRTMERVPMGSKFKLDMVFDLYQETDKSLLKSLFTAMHLLENSSLGGSGTRGHGKIKFAELTIKLRPLEFYKTGRGEVPINLNGANNIQEIVEKFDSINWGI